ncbi:MAG: ABC transporter substrate-binding protein [Deferribacterales bacterium]
MLTSILGFTHEITVNDLYGRTVVTPATVTKVAAIGPGALRLLVYSGVQDMLVGREEFEEKLSKSLRPYTYALSADYNNLPVISTGGPGVMPDMEKLIMVKPDVIFASGFSSAALDIINKMTKVPVVGVSYGDTGHIEFNKVVDSLRLIGYVTHNQKRTQDVMNKMAMMRKDLMGRVEDETPKSVYMASIAYKGANGFYSSEREHPSCIMLNLKNLADDYQSHESHIIADHASLIKAQPDFIFYDVTGIDILKKGYKEMYPELSRFNAIKEGKVYSVLPYNWYNSNVENIFLTSYFIGKVMYPEKFSDVNIAHYADEIYNAFIHINPYSDIAQKNPVYRSMTFEKDGMRFGK